MFFQAIFANAVCGRRVKTVLEEFFHRHPFSLAIDAAAPRANVKKLFELLQPFEASTRGRIHEQPDSENEQHLQHRRFEIRNANVSFENQRGQAEQRIEPAQGNHGEKPKTLIR